MYDFNVNICYVFKKVYIMIDYKLVSNIRKNVFEDGFMELVILKFEFFWI